MVDDNTKEMIETIANLVVITEALLKGLKLLNEQLKKPQDKGRQ